MDGCERHRVSARVNSQQFALPIAMEFTLVAAWSIVDAYFHGEAVRPHAASYLRGILKMVYIPMLHGGH